jgi:hypothetical protein
MVDDNASAQVEEVTAALAAYEVDNLLAGSDPEHSDTTFREAAATADGDALKRALILLADVASMMLDGDQWDSPYSPWANLGTHRGMIPSDLTQQDIEILRWVATEVSDPSISARAADLVWLQSSGRGSDLKFARLAVEKWAAEPMTAYGWSRAGRETLGRAVSIGRRMNLSDQLQAINETLVEAMASTDEAWWVAQIADFLLEKRMVGSRTDDILNSLDRVLLTLEPTLSTKQLMLTSKARLLRGAGRDEEAAAADEAQVEAILDEAASRAGDSKMVEAHFLEGAYQRARRIPRKWRSARLSELIVGLPARIREAGERSLDEMSAIQTGADISEPVRLVRESVRGKSLEGALAAMVGHAPFSKFAETKTQAEKSLDGSILGSIGGSTFASDGRKVDSTEVDNYYQIPSPVWHRMLFNYDLHISMIAIGVVVPAMEIITTEHRISEADLRYLVNSASIVPPLVENLFALGLYYGSRHEWAAALHLLAPQIEALVRHHLREAGVDTERIDSENSISTETGISTLMKSHEADEIFGVDLAWEIRALLCGPTGPNLRNLVAHGLIGAGAAKGPHAIYLWWFAMKLVFIPYYNALRAQEPQATDGQNEPGQANGDDS